MKSMIVQIPDDLRQRLDALVPILDPDRQSRNAVIRMAIRRLVEQTERERKKEQHDGRR